MKESRRQRRRDSEDVVDGEGNVDGGVVGTVKVSG